MANNKNPGKVFEDEIKASCFEQGIFIQRLNDSSQSYTESAARFTPKNPCDFHIFRKPTLMLVECKHTKNGNMSIQRSKEEDRNKMIKYHQIEALTKASIYDGVEAGFLLSFLNEKTQVESTFYMPIENFNDFLNTSDKKSINMLDVLKYNPVAVKQEKKQKYYRFDISKLFNDLERRRAKYAEDDI